jgi:hypothetical protein
MLPVKVLFALPSDLETNYALACADEMYRDSMDMARRGCIERLGRTVD